MRFSLEGVIVGHELFRCDNIKTYIFPKGPRKGRGSSGIPELSVFIAIVAADAIDDAASWLKDLTIRRPPGPIRGAF